MTLMKKKRIPWLLLLLFPCGFQVLHAQSLSPGDINGNGTIDIVDALLVAQRYAGLIDEFPVSGTATPVPEASPAPGGGFSGIRTHSTEARRICGFRTGVSLFS
ncbi:MAG: hypothetical protein JW881_07600 [Spirochaetales bacterium]|nr:hypothetical protein [Spirochaetales bacterium]